MKGKCVRGKILRGLTLNWFRRSVVILVLASATSAADPPNGPTPAQREAKQLTSEFGELYHGLQRAHVATIREELAGPDRDAIRGVDEALYPVGNERAYAQCVDARRYQDN